MSDLLRARTAPDILAALARATWHNADRAGSTCPDDVIPTPAALAEWLPDCPEAAFVEATERLDAMTVETMRVRWSGTVNRPRPGLSAPDRTPEIFATDGHYIASVFNLHARWLDRPEGERPKHPLAPIVAAWQQGRCVLDTKRRVLFGADLAGDRIEAEDEAAMLELATTAEPDGPDTAPMLDFGDRDHPAGLVPVYLLDAYRAGGGPAVSRGRGGPAPIRQRLWLHALTAIEPTDRDGSMRRFGPLAIGEHLIDHLWPYGWGYQRSDWPTLLNAIRAVNTQPFRYLGPGGVLKECHLIAFTDYPIGAPDPRALRAATFRGAVTFPEGMARGPSLSRAALAHTGMVSGPAQRLVAAWAFYRGRYLSRATSKGRRFTAPTIPRARRDEQGRYLDAKGEVILDKRGRPTERFSDGRVVLLDADDEPVAKVDQAARNRNPALDGAPAWSLDRWRRETGYRRAPGPATASRTTAWKERQRIVAAFEALKADGILGFEKVGNLYRLIPPGKVGREPDRQELLKAYRRRLEDAKRRRDAKRNRSQDPAVPELFESE